MTTPRRRFLTRLGLGSAAVGALVGSTHLHAQATASAPPRHETDDWMDTLPTAHRMMFDALSPKGTADVLHYAGNVFTANRTGYGLENREVGVLIVLRHLATAYGYNDAMWAKYGSAFAAEMKIDASATNPVNRGSESLEAVSGLGAHFAVCAMATRRLAGIAARAGGASADAVFEELGKNLIKNAHLTPAGIVAVGRAQERGFAFGYAG